MNATGSTAGVLIVGESGVGKTHYGAQLLNRLHQESGRLKMRGAATNVRAFESAMHRLSEGMSADHTPTQVYSESRWPIIDPKGNLFELVWPDYGGEQVRQILDQRRVPEVWRDRLTSSEGWLLFVRVQHTEIKEDLLSRPLPNLKGVNGGSGTQFQHSDQARVVELLQMLLFLRGIDTIKTVSRPALTVLLSCWDEMIPTVGASARPGEVLATRLPLLSEFVTCNWDAASVSVMGLSALGRPLRGDTQDLDYLNRGPESFGYVVQQDGTVDADLTIPIAEMATKILNP